jgi:nitric oxide dioxygenase
VLGQAATDDVMDAWAEAYQFLADVLIARERELYDHHRAARGGWVGWREFVVERVEPESDVIKSFYLRPARRRPDHGIRARPVPDLPARHAHARAARTQLLHLVGAGPRPLPHQREARGAARRRRPPAARTGLHLPARPRRPGSSVRVSAPAGEFFLQERDHCPIVLLSGGVGLTPMVSILDTLVDRRAARPVWHVHAALTGRHHAMKDHVRHVADEHGDVNAVVFYEFPSDDDVLGEDFDVACRITLDWIKRELPTAEADFYFCGPKGFMRMLALGLRALDVPEEHIHFEFFGPPQDLYA